MLKVTEILRHLNFLRKKETEMDLGEKIYALRAKNGMSQGELADKLGVSRQAVSKWENNSAVPDLDKLLKMSELFSVSLDELVKGEKSESVSKKTEEAAERKADPVSFAGGLPMRKIMGIVLFCMAFVIALVLVLLGGGAMAIIYAVPFVVFGLICTFCEKYTGLKCLWAACFMIIAFTSFAMGISPSIVRYTFTYSRDMTYQLLIGWVLALFNAFLIIFTSVKLGKEPFKQPQKAKRILLISLITVASAFILIYVEGAVASRIIRDMLDSNEYNYTFSYFFTAISVLEQYTVLSVLTFAITSVIRYIRLMRKV